MYYQTPSSPVLTRITTFSPHLSVYLSGCTNRDTEVRQADQTISRHPFRSQPFCELDTPPGSHTDLMHMQKTPENFVFSLSIKHMQTLWLQFYTANFCMDYVKFLAYLKITELKIIRSRDFYMMMLYLKTAAAFLSETAQLISHQERLVLSLFWLVDFWIIKSLHSQPFMKHCQGLKTSL